MQNLAVPLLLQTILMLLGCPIITRGESYHNNEITFFDNTTIKEESSPRKVNLLKTNIYSANKRSSNVTNIFQSYVQMHQNSARDFEELLSCRSIVSWRDLGPLHYPRFLKQVRCHRRRRTCMNGFFSCVPVYYPVKVLSERRDNDSTDLMIPASLRLRWKFINVDVSINCACGV